MSLLPGKPFVSVIVPAHNEEATLSICLNSLKAQQYDGAYEVIVVDNASSDRTCHAAESQGIQVIHEPRKGYVYAMMRGFSAARGEIIACTDADTLVPPNWISRLVSKLSTRNAVAITGVFSFLDGSCVIKLIGSIFGKLNWQLAGANMAVWKWAFLKAGGFKYSVNMGADKELGLRLSKIGKVLIDRRLVVKTSARRFQYDFWRTLWLYFGNDLWLLLFRKPAFFNFSDIRIPSRLAPLQQPLAQIAALVLLFASFLWYTEQSDNRLFGSVFAHGSKYQPLVALTFDDGPGPQTKALLDTLGKYGIKATFFLVGKNLERNPEIAREIVQHGHELGNHTYSHTQLAAVESPRQINDEILKTGALIEKTTGVAPRFFRPPRGWRSPWMMKSVYDLGYSVATWNVDPNDWRHPPAQVISARILRHMHHGSIVLLHDGFEATPHPHINGTLNALPEIIQSLQAKGYQFVTISEMYRAQYVFPAMVSQPESGNSIDK